MKRLPRLEATRRHTFEELRHALFKHYKSPTEHTEDNVRQLWKKHVDVEQLAKMVNTVLVHKEICRKDVHKRYPKLFINSSIW